MNESCLSSAEDDGPAAVVPASRLVDGGTPIDVPGSDVDTRESLVNDRPRGPVGAIQIPMEMITCLHGIMIDIDPHLLRADALPDGALESPAALYDLAVRAWLARHPVFAKAEVRSTGRGLHVLLWIEPAVEFSDPGERDRWAAVVKIVQSILPSDPHAPGITALTRPLGSTNSKTGRPVEVLKSGTSVKPAEAIDLANEIAAHPFRIASQLLVGKHTATCPVCRKPGSRLGVMDRAGRCYGSCGKVSLGMLLGSFMLCSANGMEVANHEEK